MKKKTLYLVLLSLALCPALPQTTRAESSESPSHLQVVYDAMIAEGSDFNQSKAMYLEYYEGVTMEAALEENGITITLDSSNEYVESGSWTFTEEGDYLTTTLESQDFYGASMAQMIMDAAVSAQGVNTSVFNGYLSALVLTEQENAYLLSEENAEDGTAKYSINIVGPYELEGLDDFVLTEEILKEQGYEPLDETYTSRVINFGKISMVINGDASSAQILVMEYGELDDLAYQAIVSTAKTLQPAGWEDFIAAFTELKEVEGENFRASLNVDEAAAKEVIEDPAEGYSYAIVNIGSTEE